VSCSAAHSLPSRDDSFVAHDQVKASIDSFSTQLSAEIATMLAPATAAQFPVQYVEAHAGGGIDVIFWIVASGDYPTYTDDDVATMVSQLSVALGNPSATSR
jgi:hypothetical protein